MNWITIVRHYRINHRPRSQTELNWFRRQPSIRQAVITAANAENDRGLRYSHQARITRKAIQQARNLLLEKIDELQGCKSFHELWLTIKRTLEPVAGIGELYIYDTSLRVGAYLNLLPNRVYLHAGTRGGAKVFGLVRQGKEWIEIDQMPRILRGLPPHEVEDILCIYKAKKVPLKKCI